MLLGMGIRSLGDGHRISLALFEHRDIQLSAHHFQLIDGSGAVHIAGTQQWPLVFPLFVIARQFCGVGGFTGALQAHKHHHSGGIVGHMDAALGAAHQSGQLVIDDLDDLLSRGQAFQNFHAHRFFGDAGDKVLDHLEVHIGFQQGHTDLPHGGPHIGFGEAAAAAQLLEHAV